MLILTAEKLVNRSSTVRSTRVREWHFVRRVYYFYYEMCIQGIHYFITKRGSLGISSRSDRLLLLLAPVQKLLKRNVWDLVWSNLRKHHRHFLFFRCDLAAVTVGSNKQNTGHSQVFLDCQHQNVHLLRLIQVHPTYRKKLQHTFRLNCTL